ncbi:hypothetical protein SNK04_014055 [Fusarium graminearum]
MPNQEQEQEQQQEQDQEEDEPTDVGLSSAGGDAATGDEVGGDLLGDSPRPKPKRTARLRARIWKSLTCSTRSCQSFRRLGPGRERVGTSLPRDGSPSLPGRASSGGASSS